MKAIMLFMLALIVSIVTIKAGSIVNINGKDYRVISGSPNQNENVLDRKEYRINNIIATESYTKDTIYQECEIEKEGKRYYLRYVDCPPPNNIKVDKVEEKRDGRKLERDYRIGNTIYREQMILKYNPDFRNSVFEGKLGKEIDALIGRKTTEDEKIEVIGYLSEEWSHFQMEKRTIEKLNEEEKEKAKEKYAQIRQRVFPRLQKQMSERVKGLKPEHLQKLAAKWVPVLDQTFEPMKEWYSKQFPTPPELKEKTEDQLIKEGKLAGDIPDRESTMRSWH